jgi:alpha-beta hydrolase superfamily lysophospholipase
MASKTQDFLESFLRERHRREMDEEENIIRSLPFFATSLGALVAALGLANQRGGALSLAERPVATLMAWGIILSTSVALLSLLMSLIGVTAMLEIARETELIEYADRLREEASARHARPQDDQVSARIDEEVLIALRGAVLQQLAEAAEAGRQQNRVRKRWRGSALVALICALTLTFALLATNVIQA